MNGIDITVKLYADQQLPEDDEVTLAVNAYDGAGDAALTLKVMTGETAASIDIVGYPHQLIRIALTILRHLDLAQVHPYGLPAYDAYPVLSSDTLAALDQYLAVVRSHDERVTTDMRAAFPLT